MRFKKKGVEIEPKQIRTATEIVRNFSEVRRSVQKDDIFIFVNSRPENVVVSFDRYEEMVNRLEELEGK